MPGQDRRSTPPRRAPSPSPAERSAELAAHQQRLKREAAERRQRIAALPGTATRPPERGK
jgi:hypothetical protein